MNPTANDYPTRTLFHEKVGTIVVEPFTPDHLSRMIDALNKRGLKLRADELSKGTVESAIEKALICVRSWDGLDGAAVLLSVRRELLKKLSGARDRINSVAEELNEEYNAGFELEEKNS